MDAVHSELAKLRTLSSQAQGKWPSIPSSLDSLISDLRAAKQKLQSEQASPSDVAVNVKQAVEDRKKAVDERQKEIYNSLNRLAKNLDKVYSSLLASDCMFYNGFSEIPCNASYLGNTTFRSRRL
jgi:predicted  nucleic acid-binding Zn-ribbon protein